MSKLIYEHTTTNSDGFVETPELLNQVRYLVLSNLNDQYKYYICYMTNAEYVGYSCCFYEDLSFSDNYFKPVASTSYYRISTMRVTSTTYTRQANASACSVYSYNRDQDVLFTNYANNEHVLIDLVADVKFNSSASSDNSTIVSCLYLISSILMFAFLFSFFKNIFRER